MRLPTALAIVACAASLAVADSASASTPAVADAAVCLRRGGGDDWSAADGTNSGRYLRYMGCFLASTLNVTGAHTLPSAVFNASAALNFTLQCGAFCVLSYPSDAGTAQFAVNAAGECECVLPAAFMTARASPNASAPCAPPRPGGDAYLRLYGVAPACSLNVSSGGCSDECESSDGCCVPKPPPGPPVPELYVAMVQWTIVAILAIAMLEAVIYSVVRCRRGPDEGYDGYDGDADLRTKDQAEELAERLLPNFPPAPAPSMLNHVAAAAGGAAASSSPSGDSGEEACVICLEDLHTLPSSKLPCGHVLHQHCLRDYLQHKLVNRNTVQCPTCRGTIADGRR